MTQKILATGLALALSMPAIAQGATFEDLDDNGDGFVTMAEFQTAMPDVSVDAFMQADSNADGALSQDELTSAQDEGILPAGDETGKT